MHAMPDVVRQETPVTSLANPAAGAKGQTVSAQVDPGQLRRAELRRIHAGRWIAWTPDKTDVAIVADTRAEMEEKLRSAGIEGLTLEVVPPATSR
jgi:hypothetical protein